MSTVIKSSERKIGFAILIFIAVMVWRIHKRVVRLENGNGNGRNERHQSAGK